MALDLYRSKRNFKRTPEPRGGARRRSRARFVVQKHAARRLHYDFRLEIDGVLKSWAVPKGPSFDPKTKRLAVATEDHPIEYARFEGVIPKPEYGAGTVIIWDNGTYTPHGDPVDGYRRGRLKFSLNGRKLRGEWTLVRTTKSEGEAKASWFLIKGKDEYAGAPEPVETSPESVESGRSLKEVRDQKPAKKTAKRTGPPASVKPQLATLVSQAPTGDDWIHEIKYDGYRMLCRVDDGKARLYTRNGKDWTSRLQPVADAIADLRGLESGWIDGELVAVDAQGRTSFGELQKALSEKRPADLLYYAFDLLHLNGMDLTAQPLVRRKSKLESLLRGARDGTLRYSEHVTGHGAKFHDQACRLALEGVIAKRADAPYRGGRGRDWVKVKCRLRQEFVIAGYTAPGGARKHFGALVLGVHDDGRLRYAGRVGTGFDERLLRGIRTRLARLETKDSPFAQALTRSQAKGVHWVKPSLVAEVEFTEWTSEGVVRQAAFLGLREDKPARAVTVERPAADPKAADVHAGVRLSNADKVLYPDQGITKRQLAEYYEAVADHMLPQLRDRPLTLVRCPEGHRRECFYQKHLNDSMHEALVRVPLREKGKERMYTAVRDAAGLIALVQIGVLEIHAWGSRRDRLEHPDRLVFDLDPAEGLAWSAVREAALRIRARLDDLGLVSFLKTTGGKGLHVVAPLSRRQNWDEVKEFAKAVADDVVRAEPRRYTATMSKAARRGKVFIDYLRNGRGATAVCEYSTRARPHAPVAVPIRWDELTEDLRPDRYNIANLRERLAGLRKDPWEDFDRVRQSLTKRMRRSLGLG